jgi:hypothetical protein
LKKKEGNYIPYDQVMHKFGKGNLHSGSKTGKKVTKRSQAIAIMMSEKRKAGEGKSEYKSKKVNTGPSKKFMSRFGKS